MDIAIMYSGGKDSTYAIDLAKEKGYDIKYLISIKPTRTDCYLFHFATVEHTIDLAKILGIPHVYATCDIADPKEEAKIVKELVEQNQQKNPIEALVLGGVGLQETQIKSIRDALFPLGIEVFASHTGNDHSSLMQQMIKKGYKILVTQVAADGLTEEWLGKELNQENFEKLKILSEKYGFHLGAEGGHYDSLVIDGPIFDKSLEIIKSEKVMETENSGHLVIKKLAVKDKEVGMRVH